MSRSTGGNSGLGVRRTGLAAGRVAEIVTGASAEQRRRNSPLTPTVCWWSTLRASVVPIDPRAGGLLQPMDAGPTRHPSSHGALLATVQSAPCGQAGGSVVMKVVPVGR